MTFNLTVRQIFSWTIQLSAQQDYQALTQKFLDIHAEIPWVDSVAAYEIYNNERVKPGQASTVHELVFKRFPLDFNRNDEEDYNSLLIGRDHTVDLNLSTPDESGLYAWAIFSIRGCSGPERAIHVEGAFDREMLELLGDLRGVYRNLLILHDTKERDVLTKLPNRQSLDARLLQVCKRNSDYKGIDATHEKSSWIAMLDIDHFKRVNDNFGHL